MAALLEIGAVCKSFGAVVVAEEISLAVAEGEALGIIGPNGAGKSSLFNLVAGNLAPDRGEIRFRGSPLGGLGPAARCRRGIARSFQIPHPFGGMSVYENLLVGARQGAGLAAAAARELCLETLEQTGMAALANRPAASLTLLERKRLELARALCARPRLLLLDEIAGGLTERECEQLVAMIRAIHARGVTIIWIEHVVRALLEVVGRLAVLDFGRLVGVGEPHAVMASAQVQASYLGVGTHG